ncbi:MAG: aldehyde dehydrogenase family protein [Methanobacterium sp.]|nr:aldehyde dehydrogenase family protein [Methanobacterium sp.]
MHMLINGFSVDKTEKITIKNPADDSFVDTVPLGSLQDAKNAINAASNAKKDMMSLTSREISQILYDIRNDLSEKLDEFAELITRETGKTIRDSKVEMERSLDTLMLSAEESKRIYGETVPIDAGIGGENTLGFTFRIPLGVVSAITPFNYPVNLAIHKIAPALAAKNTVVFKPSIKAPLTALKLLELMNFHLPAGAVNSLTGDSKIIGDEIVTNELINKVSFTGSVATGVSLTKKAGMKKITLELGGNDPLVVLEDANLDDAVTAAVKGSYLNAGQVCIAIKRIIIDDKIADDFIQKLVSMTKKLKVGDPLNPKTDIGPLIDVNAALHVENMVKDALSNGAELLCGGKRYGNYYLPTVLDDVSTKMKLVQNETFGPVAPIIRVNGVDEAYKTANNTKFGLQAGVFTENIKLARRAVKEIDAGTVLINKSTFRTDNMPFGGFKMSGMGKEGIKYAIEDMTRVKLVILG